MQRAEISRRDQVPDRQEVIGKFLKYMNDGGFPCYSSIGNGVAHDSAMGVKCGYGQIDDLRLQVLFEVPAKLKKDGASKCTYRIDGNLRKELAEKYVMNLEYGEGKISFGFDVKVE